MTRRHDVVRDFRRIAIVNRGEAAMRLIHAVREFNREHDLDLKTIALYTEPERQAMFVREASEAYSLGAATFADPRDGQRKNAYLNYDGLQHALVQSQADAVWVGWGFVAEHPDFADLCEHELGLVFIGPDGDCMRRLGDKIASKKIAEQSGVPVAAWSGGPVHDLAQAHAAAARIGFPLMVKATAGGGGRGIRAARKPEQLDEAFRRATSESLKSFGDGTVFMERMVEGARHIEVQIIADGQGGAWPVGVRDCSVQRRNQKLIEESSSPVLTEEQEKFIRQAAVRLCIEANYRNAGTVEFLYDPCTGTFAFMEVNARLQVEHPVTEETTGIDLVKLQLHVARGGRLEGDPPPVRGNAIEIRLNAEDPEKDFAPAPGRMELLRLPTGAGIRVDTGVEPGDTIPAEFDSMIAKIIARGRNRNEALSRLRRALSELAVVIKGGTTNRAFLLDLLGLPAVIEGTADVGWLDREPPSRWQVRPHGELAVALAAVEAYEQELDAERQIFLSSATRGRPRLRGEAARCLELRYGGNSYRLQVCRYGSEEYRVDAGPHCIRLTIEPLGQFERRVTCNGQVHRTFGIADGVAFRIEIDGVPHRVSRDDGGTVRSPAPAVVVAVNVKPGDTVERGDTLAIVEAMKLEMRITAPFAGAVHAVDVAENEQVDAGASILRLKALNAEQDDPATDRLQFDTLAEAPVETDARQRSLAILDELNAMMLGYDIDPGASEAMLADRAALRGKVERDDSAVAASEIRLLTRFTDLNALSRRDPGADAGTGGFTLSSTQASFFTYLRAIDTRGEGLPAAFVDALLQTLRHYGIGSLEPGAALEEALLWIHKSHSRVRHQCPVVAAVLERWLDDIDALAPTVDDELRTLLDRLIATSEDRYPAVADLAREVRFQYFDKPLFERIKGQAYTSAGQHLDALAAAPQGAQRQQHFDALVACPQPLMTLLSESYPNSDTAMRALIVECITRRYYRIRQLESVQVINIDGHHPVLTAQYGHQGSRIQLITTHADYDNLSRIGQLILPVCEQVPEQQDIVVDFYVHRNDAEESEEETLAHVRQALDAIAFPRRIRRIVTSVRIPGAGLGMAGQRYFTFRPSQDGYWEETIYRGLHPMMSKRLHLWRLGNFELERLPAAEDIYLFRGVATGNPRDERLFVVADVRDTTPVKDEAGNTVALPFMEYMFQEALAGVRLFQSHRAPRERLHWNRVLLYVWPELHITPQELRALAAKLCSAARGLGMEKIVIRARLPRSKAAQPQDTVVEISNPEGRGPVIALLDPIDHTVEPLTAYRQKVLKMRQRGLHYPYEIIRLLTPDETTQSELPPGRFTEYDLDECGAFVPVDRPYGENSANVVTGVISNISEAYSEGITRVIVLGDPSKGMGALAEAECSRIIAALDLAERDGVPLEWFAVSAGAKIAMDSGTENLDWTARVLRRLIEFTQAGGEVNLIVHGINVGAQSYWNAEATMLMHTRGILIMTPQGAMVLTGKQALDYSGSVSAEDNLGIGGYDRIMGPNGQAQYWAADLHHACRTLLRHYEYSYVAGAERFPRRIPTTDPADRDVSLYPYVATSEGDFRHVGEIFSSEHNPGRKRPFEIRKVMHAVIDQDHPPLERWRAMRDAEIGVVWDARLGGRPVCLIGLESRPLARPGFVPADGPGQWTAGTLFPRSSRKIARAINSASGNRPVVVLANLSGFDGSPESMREWQLEYGAEIGRSIVNFKGPIVFCVISRYHGGAFVVFSKSLNENLEVAALDGAYASVIGGAPAAAVVFVREVRQQTESDPRVSATRQRLETVEGQERIRYRSQFNEIYAQVLAEKRGALAEKFDAVHSVQRAMEVGSVDRIIAPAQMRPYLIDAVERGIARQLEKEQTNS